MSLGLTINGIDGFLSGKWTLHPNAVVVDDNTFVLNATGSFQSSNISYFVLPNTTYYFSLTNGGNFLVSGNAGGTDPIGTVGWSTLNSTAFNTGNRTQIYIFMGSGSLGSGTYTFTNPMLNLGDIPAPYEKKRGDRMVLPVFNGDGTVQINKKTNKRTNKYSWMGNFEGKVSGSVMENPHIAKYTPDSVSLISPATFIFEAPPSRYDQVKSLNADSWTHTSNLTNGATAQALFSFNLIEEVERKWGKSIPKITVAEKVQWLKDNVPLITGKWYGFGSSVGGNKAYLNGWRADTLVWGTPTSHVAGVVSYLGYQWTPGVMLDANGFVHFLAYADPSDGVTASTINTDYVEIIVDTKQINHPNDSGVLSAVQIKPSLQVKQAVR